LFGAGTGGKYSIVFSCKIKDQTVADRPVCVKWT
jgi:hypothetical protein